MILRAELLFECFNLTELELTQDIFMVEIISWKYFQLGSSLSYTDTN